MYSIPIIVLLLYKKFIVVLINVLSYKVVAIFVLIILPRSS